MSITTLVLTVLFAYNFQAMATEDDKVVKLDKVLYVTQSPGDESVLIVQYCQYLVVFKSGETEGMSCQALGRVEGYSEEELHQFYEDETDRILGQKYNSLALVGTGGSTWVSGTIAAFSGWSRETRLHTVSKKIVKGNAVIFILSMLVVAARELSDDCPTPQLRGEPRHRKTERRREAIGLLRFVIDNSSTITETNGAYYHLGEEWWINIYLRNVLNIFSYVLRCRSER
ncbi:MAG: hypothetical protein OXB88_00205 [Bacteriovoracales bacterium]|nr:hypothetical protein [Bacteriovoracales bacterium]